MWDRTREIKESKMSRRLLREDVEVVSLKSLPESRLTEEAGSVGAWEAPVWRLGVLNLNGRIYPEDLAKRIVAENKVTVAYDGHDGDRFGDYEPVKAVVKNPRIQDGLMYVEIFVVDPAYQEKLKAIADLGVQIGVSSVGYGETDANGLVNTHTYELVRYLDFVTTPSGQVYATTKESADTEPAKDDEGVPSSETGEPSPENLAKVERYKKVQAYILGRRNK
jgi:hypothetical protein